MSALVIKSWKADTQPINQENVYVSIAGRQQGIIAWFLSLVGIDPTTTLLIGADRVEMTSNSLAGTESRMLLLQNVCSTYYGYHKPWKQALSIFLSLSFFIAPMVGAIAGSSRGPSAGMIILMIFISALIALVYYFLNRTLTLGFVEHSGVINGIQFKRSVIENVDINHEQAKFVCLIVQQLIEAKGAASVFGQ